MTLLTVIHVVRFYYARYTKYLRADVFAYPYSLPINVVHVQEMIYTLDASSLNLGDVLLSEDKLYLCARYYNLLLIPVSLLVVREWFEIVRQSPDRDTWAAWLSNKARELLSDSFRAQQEYGKERL